MPQPCSYQMEPFLMCLFILLLSNRPICTRQHLHDFESHLQIIRIVENSQLHFEKKASHGRPSYGLGASSRQILSQHSTFSDFS